MCLLNYIITLWSDPVSANKNDLPSTKRQQEALRETKPTPMPSPAASGGAVEYRRFSNLNIE